MSQIGLGVAVPELDLALADVRLDDEPEPVRRLNSRLEARPADDEAQRVARRPAEEDARVGVELSLERNAHAVGSAEAAVERSRDEGEADHGGSRGPVRTRHALPAACRRITVWTVEPPRASPRRAPRDARGGTRAATAHCTACSFRRRARSHLKQYPAPDDAVEDSDVARTLAVDPRQERAACPSPWSRQFQEPESAGPKASLQTTEAGVRSAHDQSHDATAGANDGAEHIRILAHPWPERQPVTSREQSQACPPRPSALKVSEDDEDGAPPACRRRSPHRDRSVSVVNRPTSRASTKSLTVTAVQG